MQRKPLSNHATNATRALFFIQIFSTLSFAVLYSTLVLYLNQGLHETPDAAATLTGTFIAYNYVLHLLGGYLGGRFLSFRDLFIIGMILQILGCVVISFETLTSLNWGLTSFLTGAGLNVTCINCMLTEHFEPDDKRREKAFLWNYSGMNIGFFIGFFFGGILGEKNLYHILFLSTSFSNFIALILVFFNWKILADRASLFSKYTQRQKTKFFFVGLTIILFLFLALLWLVNHSDFSNSLILITGVLMAGVIIVSAVKQQKKAAAKKLWAFFILSLASLVFWTLYMMGPMGLMLFIKNNVDRTLLDFLIPPQWFGNINTIIIIIGGPTMAALYEAMRKKGHRITIPTQFALSLLCIGIGYVSLKVGIHFASAKGYIDLWWIVLCYFLQSIGELLISPIGYAMVGQLVPKKNQGVMMGTWLMISGVASVLSSEASKDAFGTTNLSNPLATNQGFGIVFEVLGWTAVGVGIILAILIPTLHRLIFDPDPKEHIQPHMPNAPEETPLDALEEDKKS